MEAPADPAEGERVPRSDTLLGKIWSPIERIVLTLKMLRESGSTSCESFRRMRKDPGLAASWGRAREGAWVEATVSKDLRGLFYSGHLCDNSPEDLMPPQQKCPAHPTFPDQ